MSTSISPSDQLQQLNTLRASIYKDRIDALVAVYGSVRAVGHALTIDHAYLHRLAKGEKTSPSKIVLKKLGLTP